MEAREPVQGPAGPPGPVGERGPAGADGAAGRDGVVDENAIAERVAAIVVAKLPPIRVVQKDARTGEMITEKFVPLGGELSLNFGAGPQPIDVSRSQP